MERKTIELRAHTERVTKQQRSSDDDLFRIIPDKWPRRALVIDCETDMFQRQALTFAYYCYCRLETNAYKEVQEGFFYADELDPEQVAILKKFGKRNGIEVLSRSEFIERIFWQAVRAEALIVGFGRSGFLNITSPKRARCASTNGGHGLP
jgi:hypothetical protein